MCLSIAAARRLDAHHLPLAALGVIAIDPSRGTVTHHVEGASFPNWVDTDLVRLFRLEQSATGPDRLTITTPPIHVSGQALTTTLVWERDG